MASPYKGGRGQPQGRGKSGTAEVLNALIPGGTKDEQEALESWKKYWGEEPGYGYGNFLPLRYPVDEEGKQSGEAEWAWPHAIRDPINAGLDIFGGFQTGKLKPETIGTIAGLTVNPAARQVPNMLGMQMGWRARTAALDKMIKAEMREQAGEAPLDIWKKTGWYRGSDGEWRWELPDIGAKLKPAAEAAQPGTKLKLSEVLDHPPLFAAYPHLKDLPVHLTDDGHSGVYYSPKGNAPAGMALRIRDPEDMASTALHEVQHAIQNYENFQQGGSPSAIETHFGLPPKSDAGYDTYYKLAGEVEARRTQQRAQNPLYYQTYPRSTIDAGIRREFQQVKDPSGATVYYEPIHHDPWAPENAGQRIDGLPQAPQGAPAGGDAASRTYWKVGPWDEKQTLQVIRDGKMEDVAHPDTFQKDDLYSRELHGLVDKLYGGPTRGNVTKRLLDKVSRRQEVLINRGKPGDAATVEALGQIRRDLMDGKVALRLKQEKVPKATPEESSAIDSYHGTPHDWEGLRSSDEKIGSGEGAQSFGWGHYTAGRESIGKSYKDKLSRGAGTQGNLYKLRIEAEEEDLLHRDLPLREQPKLLTRIQEAEARGDLPKLLQPEIHSATYYYDPDTKLYHMDLLRRNNTSPSLYTEFNGISLDDLSNGVTEAQLRQAFPAQIADRMIAGHGYAMTNPNWKQLDNLGLQENRHLGITSGAEYYDELSRELGGDKAASKALDKAGIPGLRFHDNPSRDSGRIIAERAAQIAVYDKSIARAKENLAQTDINEHQEFIQRDIDDMEAKRAELQRLNEETKSKVTHNYVIFDPRHMRVTHRNGIPVEPVEHDPFAKEPK